jgi:hypothetical protein
MPTLQPSHADHPAWRPGQVQIAAGGGAGRRSAKIAAGPNQSIARSAPLGAAAPLPLGGLPAVMPPSRRRGGTHLAGVGIAGGVGIAIDVGANRLGHRGPEPNPAGLRSLPAKQHAPKARPHPRAAPRRRHRARSGGRPAASPSAPVKHEWAHRLHGAAPGAGHSRLTGRHRARTAPPGPGQQAASKAGETHPILVVVKLGRT